MNIKALLKSKKVKNIALTVIEIIVVAGIIFGVLMFGYSKINKDASKTSGMGNNAIEETKAADAGSDDYYLEVNMKKNALIVYQYSSDKKSKKPYKVFRCSIGEDVKKGKYKLTNNYSWVNSNGYWHKYNSQFDTSAWIQSAGYKDRYDDTLKKSSYNAIGDNQKAGSCILLYAGDAQWIYEKCKRKTELNIIKGNKKDNLPLQFAEYIGTKKYCGWDPTDPDANNPYKKISSGTVVAGTSTVYVEKGDKPDYLSNLLAFDEQGKNITGQLKYKEITTDELGTQKVKYSCKTSSGTKLTITQKFKIIDTTCPVVTCSRQQFTYEVKSRDTKDLNSKSTVSAIENMVKQYVSCNESGVTITVNTVDDFLLDVGNFPVVIKAQDSSGNVGSCQVMCEIKLKSNKGNSKYKPDKDEVERKKDEASGNDKKDKKDKKDKEKDKDKDKTDEDDKEQTTELVSDTEDDNS